MGINPRVSYVKLPNEFTFNEINYAILCVGLLEIILSLITALRRGLTD